MPELATLPVVPKLVVICLIPVILNSSTRALELSASDLLDQREPLESFALESDMTFIF